MIRILFVFVITSLVLIDASPVGMGAETESTNIPKESGATCTDLGCRDQCRARGFTGGYCEFLDSIGFVCTCWNISRS